MSAFNALLEKHAGQKLSILGFPCNQFGQQEPCNEKESLNCYKYIRPGGGWEPHTDFHILKKTEVNGHNESSLYTFLKSTLPPCSNIIGEKRRIFWDPIKTTDITWNFEKFIIDRRGKPRFRFSPKTEVGSLQECIEELLKE